MSWIQISFQTKRDQTELLSDALTATGALSVTLQDAKDQPLLEPGVGETPLWDRVIVTGLFEGHIDKETTLEQIASQLSTDCLPPHEITPLEEKVWEREWMKEFHPMRFGERTWICPSWQSVPDSSAVNILLDPGLAFGTGTHPTTALCLEWLDQNIQGGEKLIDFGCGSGILAIAAAKLGAQKIWAIDNDPQALIATKTNAENNQVLAAIECIDASQHIEVKADIIVANILANPLITLEPLFKTLLKPGALAILSGILNDQQNAVLDAYQDDFQLINRATRDDWSRLDLRRL